jgi:toxin FitB
MATLDRALLDTSVIIALGEAQILYQDFPRSLAISVATLAELHFGVLVAKDDFTRQKRLRLLGRVERFFAAIEVDSEVARAYAAVARAVIQAGRQPRKRVMDQWIAATAMAHQIPLFTRNIADFSGLENLIDLRAV